MKDQHQIQTFLNAVSQRLHVKSLITMGVMSMAWLLGVFWSGAILSPWIVHFSVMRLIYWVILAASLLYMIGKTALRQLFHRSSHEELALFVEQAYPFLENRLISAVQFSKDLDRGNVPYSPALAMATIQSACRDVLKIDLPLMIDFSLVLRRLGIFTFLVILTLASFMLWPKSLGKPFVSLWTAPWKPQETQTVTVKPDRGIGDLTVVLHYPLYTGLDDVTLENSSGDITALKGTEVDLIAKSLFPVKTAMLVFDGDESSQIPMAIAGEDQITGHFTLLNEGGYTFQLTTPDLTTIKDYKMRHLTLFPDEFPEIHISAPENALEVHEKDRIEISYEAGDDFGLSNLRFIYDAGSGEEVIHIQSFSDQRRTRGTYSWNLAAISTLKQGDHLVFWLEVFDNDVISGPKSSRSKRMELSIRSQEANHEMLQEALENIFDEMILLLALEIETPIPNDRTAIEPRQTRILSSAENLIVHLERLLREIEADPLADAANYYALENLKSSFSAIFRDSGAYFFNQIMDQPEEAITETKRYVLNQRRNKEIEELEKDVLFLLTILERDKLRSIANSTHTLSEAQNELLKLMERMQNAEETDLNELTDQIQKVLEEIQETMDKIGEKLAEMAKTLPDEFLNAEALQNLNFEDINQSIQDIMQQLAKGDREAAMAKLQKLLSQLSEMMAHLDEAATEFAFENFDQISQALEESIAQLDEITEAEEHLLEMSETLQNEIQKEQFQDIAGGAENFFKRQQERVAAIRKLLEKLKGNLPEPPAQSSSSMPIPWESLQERLINALNSASEETGFLEDLLKIQDIEEALNSALRTGMFLNDLQALLESSQKFSKKPVRVGVPETQAAQLLLSQVIDDLDEILKTPPQKNPDRQISSSNQSLGQRGVATQTKDLQKKMQRLIEKSPFIPKELPQHLDNAAQKMGEASQHLNRIQMKGAIRSQRESLNHLSQARSQLEQMKQQMNGQGSNPMPFGWSFNPRPNDRFPFGDINDFRDVEIPSEEQYKVPRNFREDILEAMKKDAPKPYQKLIEDYYKQLVH